MCASFLLRVSSHYSYVGMMSQNSEGRSMAGGTAGRGSALGHGADELKEPVDGGTGQLGGGAFGNLGGNAPGSAGGGMGGLGGAAGSGRDGLPGGAAGTAGG